MTLDSNQPSLPPDTTREQDRKTEGQRHINRVWELTQAAITCTVIGTAMFVSARIALLVVNPDVSERSTALAITAFVLISNATFLVLGFYFGRTNHQRTGGIGGDTVDGSR